MSEPGFRELEPEQPLTAKPRSRGLWTIAVVALAIAVMSLVLNAYLLGAIQSSENTIDDLESQISGLENTTNGFQSSIADLENTVDGLESQVSELENTANDLESQISDLEDTVDSLESRISDLENATNGGTTGPNVQLAQADAQGSNAWKINVAGVSESRDVDSFKAIVIKNGAVWRTLDPLGTGSESNITFTDLGGEGKLTTGDYFMVQCDPGASYEICIVWRDSGNVKGSESWAA